MNDLAMYLLDLCMNSISAKASLITILIEDLNHQDEIRIRIHDDGKGMDNIQVHAAQDPFYTSRKTRKVGLGIPFAKQLAISCEGRFEISSKINEGTNIYISLKKSHIDLPPWGDIGESIATMVQYDTSHDIVFTYQNDKETFRLDTRVIKKQITPIVISEAQVILWIKDYVNEGLYSLWRIK